jgi:hypothetical protein
MEQEEQIFQNKGTNPSQQRNKSQYTRGQKKHHEEQSKNNQK